MSTTTIADQPATTGGSRPKPRRSKGPSQRGDRREAWFLVLPALIPVALFSVYPLIQGVYLGFTDAEAAGLPEPYRASGIVVKSTVEAAG